MMTRHPLQRSGRLSELDSLFATVEQVPIPVPVRIPVGEVSERDGAEFDAAREEVA
jgi:hypothetical protein